jgi:hypothetical protein
MKWFFVSVLVLIAAVLAFFGNRASADPQGRGGKFATIFWCASSVALGLAVALAIVFFKTVIAWLMFASFICICICVLYRRSPGGIRISDVALKIAVALLSCAILLALDMWIIASIVGIFIVGIILGISGLIDDCDRQNRSQKHGIAKLFGGLLCVMGAVYLCYQALI